MKKIYPKGITEKRYYKHLIRYEKLQDRTHRRNKIEEWADIGSYLELAYGPSMTEPGEH